jgi:hypothetical protein
MDNLLLLNTFGARDETPRMLTYTLQQATGRSAAVSFDSVFASRPDGGFRFYSFPHSWMALPPTGAQPIGFIPKGVFILSLCPYGFNDPSFKPNGGAGKFSLRLRIFVWISS